MATKQKLSEAHERTVRRAAYSPRGESAAFSLGLVGAIRWKSSYLKAG
jgi:hypothetical protein